MACSRVPVWSSDLPSWSLLARHRSSSLGFSLCLEFKMQNVREWLFIPADSTHSESPGHSLSEIFTFFSSPSSSSSAHLVMDEKNTVLARLSSKLHETYTKSSKQKLSSTKGFRTPFLSFSRGSWLYLLSAYINVSIEKVFQARSIKCRKRHLCRKRKRIPNLARG